MPATFTDLVERWSGAEMREDPEAAFFGILAGITADTHQETATLCARMHLLDDEQSPDDILPIIAEDRRLGRYYLETSAQHRARLINAWYTYAKGASERAFQDESDAAGFGPTNKMGTWGASGHTWGESGYVWGDRGTRFQYRPQELGPRGEPPPYWSQYWIVFDSGMHPVSGPPIPWGTFVWGDTYDGVWGPVGYSQDFKRTALGIAKKWKSSRWVLRGFVFKIGGIQLWGQSGHLWGEAGGIWGGAIEVTVPL